MKKDHINRYESACLLHAPSVRGHEPVLAKGSVVLFSFDRAWLGSSGETGANVSSPTFGHHEKRNRPSMVSLVAAACHSLVGLREYLNRR